MATAVWLPVPPALANHCENVATEQCTHAGSNGSTITGSIVVGLPDMRSNAGGGGSAKGDSCVGCEYTVVPACWVNDPDNSADALCGAAIQSCPDTGILFWVYRRHPGETWDQIGTACIGPSNPVVTLDDVAGDAQEYLKQLTPNAATISAQPADRSVVNIPTYFAATGAEPLTGQFGPAGIRMTITATPTYEWDFGDGSEKYETSSPGGPYPTGDVTHTYLTAGRRTVTLATRWTATFTVVSALGTFGPFPVGGPQIAPTSSLGVDVREARAELVGG